MNKRTALGLIALVFLLGILFILPQQSAKENFLPADSETIESNVNPGTRVDDSEQNIDDAFLARWNARYPTVCAETNVPVPEDDARNIENSYDNYALVEHRDEASNNRYGSITQELVGHTSAGTTTLVTNILGLVPRDDLWPRNALVEWSFPKTGGKLFFTSHLPNSDAPFTDLYTYDLQTGVITLIPYASVYGTDWPWIISPDGFRFLSAYCGAESREYFGRRLYVVDLWTDTARLVKTLPPGETFMQGISAFHGGSVEGTKQWLNDYTIQFTVYQESTTENENPVLRIETLSI